MAFPPQGDPREVWAVQSSEHWAGGGQTMGAACCKGAQRVQYFQTVSVSPGTDLQTERKILAMETKTYHRVVSQIILVEHNYNNDGEAIRVYSMGRKKEDPTWYMKSDTKETDVTKQYP